MEFIGDARALYIVINAGYSDEVMEVAQAAGAKGATILNARGESSHHKVFMGITIDSEKEIILCLVNKNTANKIMEAVKEKAGTQTPAHSVCFTLPVDKIVGVEMPAILEADETQPT